MSTAFAHVKLTPCWDELYVKSKIQKELNIKFKGVGWYETDTDTLLIMDAGWTTGTKFYDKRPCKLYHIYVWNSKTKADIIQNVQGLMAFLMTAPSRSNFYDEHALRHR